MALFVSCLPGPLTSIAEGFIDHDLPQTRDSSVQVLWDENSLPSCQPTGFQDNRVTACLDILDSLIELCRGEGAERSGGDIVPKHEVFRECLGALHARGECARTKNGNPN